MLAVGTFGVLIATGYRIEHPIATAILAAVALAAEREAIQLTPAFEVSVASLVSIFAAVVCGPVSAAIAGGVGLLAVLPRRDVDRWMLRWMTWTSIRIIVTGVAAVVVVAVLNSHPGDFWIIFAAVAAGFSVEGVLDLALGLVAPAIRHTSRWQDAIRSVAPAMIGTLPLQTPLIAILAYSYARVSPWSVALFAIPGVAAHRLFRLYRQQRETTQALKTANDRLAGANLSFATALVATLDARDRYTAGHSAAVAVYARDIAARMGLGQQEQELAHLCGLVHDVGKIGLPAGLLEKPGALTLEERRLMERHSEIGERILRNVADYAEIAGIVRHHHERVDGNGYPDRLSADEIPLLARIIAVADAYNAMTSDRPYRDAMPSRVARLRLAQAVESQFDTSVVAAFEAVLSSASEEYRMGTDAVFDIGYGSVEQVLVAENKTLAEDLLGVAQLAAIAY